MFIVCLKNKIPPSQNTMDAIDVSVYDAQADTISVDDIAKNINNRIVMMRIKRNNANDYQINELSELL